MVRTLDPEKLKLILEGHYEKGLTTITAISKYSGSSHATCKKVIAAEKAKSDASKSILDKATDKVDKALIASCENGNSGSLRTYFQLQNRLVERKEETVKIELSVAERIQIANEVVTGLREQYRLGGRACSVCGRPALLSGELCEDRGQDTTEGNPVSLVPISS